MYVLVRTKCLCVHGYVLSGCAHTATDSVVVYTRLDRRKTVGHRGVTSVGSLIFPLTVHTDLLSHFD